MDNCSKKDSCQNYHLKCYSCAAMSDLTNHYPLYKEDSPIKTLSGRLPKGTEKFIREVMKDGEKAVSITMYEEFTTINIYPYKED